MSAITSGRAFSIVGHVSSQSSDPLPVSPFSPAHVEPDRLVTFTFSFSREFQVHGWFTFYREHLTRVPPIGPRRYHRRRDRREYFPRSGYH